MSSQTHSRQRTSVASPKHSQHNSLIFRAIALANVNSVALLAVGHMQHTGHVRRM